MGTNHLGNSLSQKAQRAKKKRPIYLQMKKQLLTVGDSFTYGDELDDVYQAWPYKLADQTGSEVHNMGLSGASNASILRRALEELSTNHYDLVIVGWTNPGRIEWKDGTGLAYNLWPGFRASDRFCQETPWRNTLIEYISQHHCAEYLYQQYLIQVIALQSYCQLNQINLLMMDVMHVNYYRSVGQEQHNKLSTRINTENFIGWGEFGMHELTVGLPKGPGQHPLERGHKKIADTIDEHIRNRSWLS
jgi:hypothetical protein